MKSLSCFRFPFISLLGAVLILTVSSCASKSNWQFISPEAELGILVWREEERLSDIAKRTVTINEGASHHLIRLQGAEEPHVHDTHDLTVFMLAGKVAVRFGDRTVIARKGDVIDVPRGTLHWAENLSSGASEVYAVFSPPFDGEDYRVVG